MSLPLKSSINLEIDAQQFFENPLSEACLVFVHNQAASFNEAVQKIEGQTVTVFEIIDSINGLKTILELKLEDHFLPSRVKLILENLEMEGLPNVEVKSFMSLFLHSMKQLSTI